MERNNRGIKYKELKTVGKNFSKICKNYSKEKISRVVPVNIILSPFPYGFHPYNGEMHEGDLRVSLKGTQARKRKRERGGEKELLAEASVGGSTRRSNRLQGATSDR